LVSHFKEEKGLRILKNRVLRKIYGTKRKELSGDWRTQHNEEFHDMYCSSNVT
jgi:hypothetical protein